MICMDSGVAPFIPVLSSPQMAEEISKPLSAAQKVTMVSSGSSEVGASKLAGEVLDIMTKLPATVEKLTGIDIALVNGAARVQDDTENPST